MSHADGAKAHKASICGVKHTAVSHSQKFVDGKCRKPTFVKTFTIDLDDDNGPLRVQGGTQIIDRFWRSVRSEAEGRLMHRDSEGVERLVRAAQWRYWHKGQDLWKAEAQTFRTLRR